VDHPSSSAHSQENLQLDLATRTKPFFEFQEKLFGNSPDDIVSFVRPWSRVQKTAMSDTSRKSVKRSVENCIVVKEMSDTRPVRCQKCGKPLGYVTVLAKGLTLTHPLQDVKIIAICMGCAHSKK
jgi:hypothetical protein